MASRRSGVRAPLPPFKTTAAESSAAVSFLRWYVARGMAKLEQPLILTSAGGTAIPGRGPRDRSVRSLDRIRLNAIPRGGPFDRPEISQFDGFHMGVPVGNVDRSVVAVEGGVGQGAVR